ncbi:MAG: alpha/beta hydrolase [Pseudomonadota bacterium]
MMMNAGRFISRGSGGVPLVCLHGIGGGAVNFASQLECLSDTRRVLAWDMPGYGGTTRLQSTTFAHLSDALLNALDNEQIDRAHIAGHSIGGMLAQEIFLRNPDRVTSLTLIATTPAFGGRDDSFKEKFLAARLAPLNFGKTMADIAPSTVPHLVGPNTSAAVIEAAVNTMAAVPDETFRDILACLVTFNRYREVESITAPCCLIAGEVDDNAPVATMRKMAQRLPDAEIHEIASAGHLVTMEESVICNDIVARFLARIDASG